MSLLDWFKRRPPETASLAKERLQIIISQERAQRNSPDYLPMLRRELLEVILKYVKVDENAIQIRLDKEGGQDILEMNVQLPGKERLA
jgi:cell division topological specificity factor